MRSSSDPIHSLEDREIRIGTLVDGRFRVERVVGRGGFGRVYYCTQLPIDRPVALKVLLEQTGGHSSTEAFLREARTVARLGHPNIVQLHDFGVLSEPEGDRPWMALEWVEGITLQRLLRERRGVSRFTPAECLDLLRPLFDAIAYVHEQGIVHRDIKPANVMLSQTSRGTVLKVLDFGIAKADESSGDPGTGVTETRSTVSAFSVNYAAPEQLLRARTGPWTDVHALALIVTEMLVGARPYASEGEVEYRVVSPDRPTPSRHGIDVGGWEPVLARAMALQSSARYPNARAFLQALEASLATATHLVREEAPTARGGDGPGLERKRAAVAAMAAAGSSEPLDATPAPQRTTASRGRTSLIAFAAIVALAGAAAGGYLAVSHRAPPVSTSTTGARPSVTPASEIAPARASAVSAPEALPANTPPRDAPTAPTAATSPVTPPAPMATSATTRTPHGRGSPHRTARTPSPSRAPTRATGADTYVPPE